MATPTPITEGQDPFQEIENRYMSAMSRLQVLKEVMGVDEVPNELAPAAYVLQDTVDDVVQLYDDLTSWHFDHEHTPKAKEVQSHEQRQGQHRSNASKLGRTVVKNDGLGR